MPESERLERPGPTLQCTIRKLADHFNGDLPSVISGRTRSGGAGDTTSVAENALKNFIYSAASLAKTEEIQPHSVNY